MIRELIGTGINVNVTLLFSPERYRAVAQAYMDGLSARAAAGQRVDNVASVASFFLSRIDTAVDKEVDALVAKGNSAARTLRGKAAIASACRAYEIYEEMLGGSQWQALAGLGARPQRLLWASTSTKDPTFSPVKYVEELVVPDTVNTMPLETLNTYRRVGRPALRLERHIAESADQREAFERIGIDLDADRAATRARRRRQVHRTVRQAAAVAGKQAQGAAELKRCTCGRRGAQWTAMRYASNCGAGPPNCASARSRPTAACATRPIPCPTTLPSR